MNRLVKRICNKKIRYWATYLNYRTQEDYSQLKNLRIRKKNPVKNAKKKYDKKIAFGNRQKKVGPLCEEQDKKEIRNNFFSQRVPEQWNNLPEKNQETK